MPTRSLCSVRRGVGERSTSGWPSPMWSCSYGDIFPISYMRFKTIMSTRLCLFGRQGQADSMPPSLLSSLQHRAPSATNIEHPEACMNIQRVGRQFRRGLAGRSRPCSYTLLPSLVALPLRSPLTYLFAQWGTYLMKVLQEFPVGLQQSSLVIGDGTRVAERFDDRLRFSQFVARDLREQVMLDLVVQTTVPEVGKGVGFDVSGGENLPA